MNWLAEQLAARCAEAPEHPFLFDGQAASGVSYEWAVEISGKVFAFLSARGVGCGDTVLVNLPRGVRPILAALGVWRAGAAVVIVENTYAPERVGEIRRDAEPVLELDEAVWREIMLLDARDGFVDVDEHDPAYLVYTSGTTGRPKGVLHEYGNLPEAAASARFDGAPIFAEGERMALTAPLNFVAAIVLLLIAVSRPRMSFHVIPYSTVKSPEAFRRYLTACGITCAFLTPSYVRAFGSKPGRSFRTLILSSEPVGNLQTESSVTAYNVYSMSESGYLVCLSRLTDGLGPHAIGRPQSGRRVRLEDESGREVADGETGELCVECPYVRGYRNLPEENACAFRDGFYRTGDLARRLPSGEFVLAGRKTDMVKINGNRVEPAEVEAVIGRVLGLRWCAVRGFEDEDRAFLAAYYADDVELDANAARERLARHLPYYMLPLAFVRLEKLPLSANGKLLRRLLPRPSVAAAAVAAVAPRNGTERALCAAMAEVLGIPRIGATDDFYALGGDSIRSLKVVLAARLDGLNASDVFRGRTPERIAADYLKRHAFDSNEPADVQNARALARPHPLGAAQLYMFDYQCYTPLSTMYNTFVLLRTDRGRVDAERFAAAVERAIRNHPALLSEIAFDEDGEIVQTYRPDKIDARVTVARMTEAEAARAKDGLVRPYRLVGQRLFHVWVAETERSLYLFFDAHHIMFDGTSMRTLLGDVARAYRGEPLATDYYYLLMERRERAVGTAAYDAARDYFEQTYGGSGWTSMPPPDHASRENEMGSVSLDVGLTHAAFDELARATKLSRNELFVTAFGLALSIRTGASDVQFSWLYDGREDALSVRSCGLLFHDMPVAFRFRDDQPLADVFRDVRGQVERAIAHAIYPYNEKTQNVVVDETPCVLYQTDLRGVGALADFGFEAEDVEANGMAAESVLEMMVRDEGDGFVIDADYAASRYDEATVLPLCRTFVAACRVLVADCRRPDLVVGDVRREVAACAV